MPKQSRIPIKMAPEVLKGISGRMKSSPNPKLGKFIINLVKSPERIEAFRANPELELKTGGIPAKDLDVKLLVKVVESINKKRLSAEGVAGSPANKELTNKERSSHQERAFNNSRSWYWNMDGYNVLYDMGHSAQREFGQTIGFVKNFAMERSYGGVNLQLKPRNFEAINKMLGKLFFPSQPLVTPELIEHIKQSVKKRRS